MANETTVDLRNIAAHWLFKEFWHSNILPSTNLYYEYTKTLMNLAGADGVLAVEERQWILGNLAAKGGTEEMHNFFKNYQPNKEDLEKTINQRQTFVHEISRCLLFEAFQAASADNELHKDERNAIYRLGRAMKLEDKDIEQVEELVKKERDHRKQVVNLMFPQGLHKACDNSDKDFENNPSSH